MLSIVGHKKDLFNVKDGLDVPLVHSLKAVTESYP